MGVLATLWKLYCIAAIGISADLCFVYLFFPAHFYIYFVYASLRECQFIGGINRWFLFLDEIHFGSFLCTLYSSIKCKFSSQSYESVEFDQFWSGCGPKWPISSISLDCFLLRTGLGNKLQRISSSTGCLSRASGFCCQVNQLSQVDENDEMLGCARTYFHYCSTKAYFARHTVVNLYALPALPMDFGLLETRNTKNCSTLVLKHFFD